MAIFELHEIVLENGNRVVQELHRGLREGSRSYSRQNLGADLAAANRTHSRGSPLLKHGEALCDQVQRWPGPAERRGFRAKTQTVREDGPLREMHEANVNNTCLGST